MVKFDTSNFVQSVNNGDSPIQSLGGAFGLPSCLTDLTEELLSLLPGNILAAMNAATQDGIDKANNLIKRIKKNILWLFGIDVVTNEDGEEVYVCRWFKYGTEPGSFLTEIAEFIGAATAFATTLYNNIQAIAANIERLVDCLRQLGILGNIKRDSQDVIRDTYTEDGYDAYIRGLMASDMRALDEATTLLNSLLAFKESIDNELARRAADPSLEPQYSDEVLDAFPNLARFVPPGRRKELLRLSYGPPVSINGKFLLSVDGLYYDSQASGTFPVLYDIQQKINNIEKNQIWRLDQDPNLGGRGKDFTLDDAKYYIDSIFDDKIIDDSLMMRDFYEKDELLQSLIGQRNRRVFDVSGEIQLAIEQELGDAIVNNLQQVMLSESAHYLEKINKRKKQIELAVKVPISYGKGALYRAGEIPINDFSYLQGINFRMDLEKQRRLVIDQDDVSGVILPIEITFVEQVKQEEDISLDHLLLNDIGLGSIVSNPSGTRNSKLSINTSVETDGLIALYNLLSFEIVPPSSTTFKLKNSSFLGADLNAQIVAPTTNRVFNKGVGIAYLEGITKHYSVTPTNPTGVGSYIKLPQKKEFQDLLYNKRGATFEAWVYAPHLDNEGLGFNADYTASGLYRLILANENTGLAIGAQKQQDILDLQKDNSTDICRGLIFGFSRDRRLTKDLYPSNSESDNDIDDTCLVLAPTQSYDSSSIGFINKFKDITDNCYQNSSIWYGMRFPINQSVNGVSLSSCNTEFCQITLTFDPIQDKVSFYCDGQVLTTSSYMEVFGIDPKVETLKIPSIKRPNSFEYNATSMASVDATQLRGGPKLGSYFTPWIIGGGYTDGMQTGNFMGGQYGGIISGLKGFLGGIKFYSKPLSSDQVLNNFNASKEFFKNIYIPALEWEPIISE